MMNMMHNDDKVKRMVGAFGLAIGVAYAMHQGATASSFAVGFANEIMLAVVFVVRRVF